MSALVSALDAAITVPSQYGENGQLEYTWVSSANVQSLEEKIVQLHFQLTRTEDAAVMQQLAKQANAIFVELDRFLRGNMMTEQEHNLYLDIMCRLIAQTRDITQGKGEYMLSYMLLDVLNDHHPELAKRLFSYFLLPLDFVSIVDDTQGQQTHPYGSWKDVKYMYKYNPKSDLVDFGIQLMNEQLRKDAAEENDNNLSLCAKWVPREGSQFGELFEKLACSYFSHYLESAKNEQSRRAATLKAKMEYRKMIAALNRRLDTTQIKQCSGRWAQISPQKQTSITMQRQRRAFLNVRKDGKTQRSSLKDRMECAQHFREYAKLAEEGKVKVKGQRIGLNDFTKDALTIISSGLANDKDNTEVQLLNAQWRDNATQNGIFGNMIAMVDVSSSMYGDPMYAAIALGIRIAENSVLGQRVLTFSVNPKWVQLDDCSMFVDKVKRISESEWGGNTNFEAAFRLILDTIVKNRLPAADVENLIFVVLSDMQIDMAAGGKYKSVLEFMRQEYANTGIQLWGTPFQLPHILFWNLRSTSGFPSLSSDKNVSMMSGFSPMLLNLFCEKGLDGLRECTPWKMLVESLQCSRYNFAA